MSIRDTSPEKNQDAKLSGVIRAAAGAPLPSPRGVALEVMRLTRDDNVTVKQIAEALSADPALSGRLIEVANSAGRGRGRAVVAVHDAVIVLGLGTVRQLALGFSLIADHGSGNCLEFDYPAFWANSLLLALGAETVADHVGYAAPEEMFACGLLAQVGQLAFATLYPDEYGGLLRLVPVNSDDKLHMLERTQFGLDSVELSVMMLRDWGLPDVFLRAVSWLSTERPNRASEQPRVIAVMNSLRLAMNIGRWYRADCDQRLAMRLALVEQGLVHDIGTELLAMMVGTIAERWAEWSRRLKLPARIVGDPVQDLMAGQ